MRPLSSNPSTPPQSRNKTRNSSQTPENKPRDHEPLPFRYDHRTGSLELDEVGWQSQQMQRNRDSYIDAVMKDIEAKVLDRIFAQPPITGTAIAQGQGTRVPPVSAPSPRPPEPLPSLREDSTPSPVSPPSRLLVPLTPDSFNRLCVCVLSMGPPTHESRNLMATYQQQAESAGCGFSAIEINDHELDTKHLVICNVPVGSTVVLLAGQPMPAVSADDFLSVLFSSDVKPSLFSAPMAADSEAAQHALDHLPERVRQQRERERNASRTRQRFHVHESAIRLPRTAASEPRWGQAPRPIETHTQSIFPHLGGGSGHPPSRSSNPMAPHRPQASAPKPLAVLVRWLALPTPVTQSPIWSELVDASPAAAKLAELFSDLCMADPKGNKGIKALLSTVAHTMAIDRDFAQQVLALAPDVDLVCADRTSYTAYQLQTALMVREASAPDCPRDEVTRLARQAYRRKWIHEAAHAKVKAINKDRGAMHHMAHREELETQWAYVVRFTDSGLELGGEVKHEGRFIAEFISKVSPEDAQRALSRLKADEATHFEDFLALWTPWQSYLRRAMPRGVEALEATLRDPDRARDFDRQAVERLKSVYEHSDPHPSEVRQLANQLSKQDELERWKALTLQALQAVDEEEQLDAEERQGRWETLFSTRSRSPSSDLIPRTPADGGLLRV